MADAINITEVDTLIEDTEEEIIIPDFNLSNDADNATLAFFSNPMYLSMIKRREKLVDNNKDYKKNVKFYRKRLISLFKDLIKDDDESPPPTNELKEMYNRFVNTAIHYFQMIDKKDIIQGQYFTDLSENVSNDIQNIDDILPGETENLTINEANDKMMKKTLQYPNLNNYVINKNENSSNEFRIIPLKLEIDLKTPQLKTKGVKLKTKVKKNTEEDLSQ